MAIFQGVIFPNRQAFEGKQGAVFNYYKAKDKNVDTSVVTSWSTGIDSLDDNKVLMQVDERIDGFPWSPEQVIDVSTDNPKWFDQNLTP